MIRSIQPASLPKMLAGALVCAALLPVSADAERLNQPLRRSLGTS